MILVLAVILIALVFTYTNGFHDTANSIATVVSTKVLTPRQAIVLATFFNLIGALVGTAVASTVGSGMVDSNYVNMATIFCAMLSAIAWNLLTWYCGIPSSSSHALIGGLVGAALASAHGDWSVVIWATEGGHHWWQKGGLFYKVIIPMITSPLCGFAGGLCLMSSLYVLLLRCRPKTIAAVFGKLQLASASYMGFAHGTNDAQKTMGIITLALFLATKAGNLDDLPAFLKFLQTPKFEVARWVQIICGLTMAIGTAAGGWRIIKTLGQKMVKLQPVHGFAAETTGATILFLTALLGMPVSTTHAVTTAIMGVGTAKSPRALKLTVVERIIWAWLLTLPASGLLAYLMQRSTDFLGWTR
ncbi:MAG: inorganic phosphate transporter [Verrucomicrobia bacterium]|nr:inorganic phosphate transporter [Verrucomicrobiota bacterium]